MRRWLHRGEHALLLTAVVAWLWASVGLDRWPSGDGPHILGGAMRLAQQLREGDLWLFVQCFSSLLAPQPPGAYLPSTIAYVILGTQLPWAHLVGGALVLWLCLDGVRRLGGIAGCVWVGATGLVWVQAENAGVDLVAAAAVVQSLSHLVASDRLRLRRHTLLWGAWMGVAFLSKYTAPMFLWAPCIVAGWWVLSQRRWKALASAVLAFAVVALPWWATRAAAVWRYVQASNDTSNPLINAQGSLVDHPWAREALSWYPAALVDAWGWPGVIALLVCLVVPWRWKQARPGAWTVPLLGALGGMAMLNDQNQRQDRYMLPMMPIVAAAAGSSPLGLVALPIGLVGLYGAARSHLEVDDPPANRQYTHDLVDLGSTWPYTHEAYGPVDSDPELWGLDSALRRVRAVHGSDQGTVGFLLDEAAGAPGYGMIVSRSMVVGYRWHVATVMTFDPGRGPGGSSHTVFVGPFTFGDWPSREFDTLLAITSTSNQRAEGYLERSGYQLVEQWKVNDRLDGRIFSR